MKDFKPTIGLEVHACITNTKTKLFSKGNNQTDERAPNSCIDLLDLGLPGALPVLNPQAVFSGISTCFALNMSVPEKFSFDRKSYFYPDLPLGFQLTQFFHPIGTDGWLPIYLPTKRKIKIKQLHLETDAGKSVHESSITLLDFNRSGAPLMEIVTYPDFNNGDEVVFFVKTLASVLRHLGVSDAAMEKGNLRVDVNISVSNTEELGVRTEIKNLNSTRAIRKAIEFEFQRQVELLKSGNRVTQETRLFDDKEEKTVFLRDKEDAGEYLYFREPDLPDFRITSEIIHKLKSVPPMPYELMDYLYSELNIRENLLNLTENPVISAFVRSCLTGIDLTAQHQMLKLICGRIFYKLQEQEEIAIPISHIHLQTLAKIILTDKPNESTIKAIIDDMWDIDRDPHEIIKAKGLNQIKDPDAVRIYVSKSIQENPMEVDKYLSGKTNLRAFFLGKVMKLSNNLVNIEVLNQVLDEELYKLSTHKT